jgi:hypothetical protein
MGANEQQRRHTALTEARTMPNLFERLSKNRPAPVEEAKQPDYAQKMLNFVLRWPRPSISTADMMTYGPKPRQNAEEVLKLATILEKQGWLTPKSDQHHWDITRRPIVHPKLITAR